MTIPILQKQQYIYSVRILQPIYNFSQSLPPHSPSPRLNSAFLRWETPKVGSMFSILIVISVLYPVSNIIGALVREKELRIKEGLKMMGLTDAAHTASWVFHFACLFFFMTILLVLASGGVFANRCAMLIYTPSTVYTVCTLHVFML